jgi:hypothetical protein
MIAVSSFLNTLNVYTTKKNPNRMIKIPGHSGKSLVAVIGK